MAARIRIGTASWTDPGFVEDWYPPKLPASARLRWYAEHFDYVEINSTFYAIPTRRTVERWAEETPDDFLFDAKLPKALSRHSMQVKFLPPDLRSKVPSEHGHVKLTPESESAIVQRFLTEMQPLIESNKLGAFLLQLSPAFRPATHELSELDSLQAHLHPHPLAIELRNRDWVSDANRAQTLEYFTSRRLTFVLVDAPESEHFTVMPGMDCVTNPDLAYLRFHGRNAEGYIRGRTVAERFDYDYPPAEVEDLAGRVRKVAEQVRELRAVANNNRSNYAPKLAELLREKLAEYQELQRSLKPAAPKQRSLL